MPPKLGNNPVDSFRKAQKKQDIKKGKEAKSSNKSNQLAYTDTFLLEIEIKSLQERSQKEELDKNLSAHFTQLKEEFERIKKAKEEFVEEHPEKKAEIYKHLSAPSAQAQAALARRRDEKPQKPKQLLDKKGMPINPTKSVYYDPVYNPTGVAPPGMPYAEKESDESEEDDDDIPMPSALRPDDTNDSVDEDSDLDDIPMPAGPPPSTRQPVSASKVAAGPKITQTAEITEADKKQAAASATISSAPQLRDLQKESAIMMPAQLLRKKK
ncbi:hypothetical protein E3Q23_00265 [Wallemia mellicola]|nr:hypothetical protein E3Q23_00265 [Wallemia mellicola]